MKHLTLILLFLIALTPSVIFAQEEITPTAAPSANQIPESDEEIEKVQRIKDIVASKVAELNLVEKKGIIGTVIEVSNTKIKVMDNKDEEIDIDVDELTKFDFEDEDFGISDLEKGVIYSFIGLYNKDTETLLARFISQPDSIPTYIEGAISSLNEDDFQIEVIDSEGKTSIIDIETSTDTSSVDMEGALEESGFTDLEKGKRVIVVGFTTEDKTVSASRLIHFNDIPPTAEVLAKLSQETTTATGSGNNLEIIEAEVEEEE